MKRAYIALLFVFAASCIGIAWAQVATQPILINDFKVDGTALGYFHKVPAPYFLNFRNGAKVNGRTVTLGYGNAGMNPDLGFTVGSTGVQLNTNVDAARPTCAAAYRGVMYTVETSGTGDAGVKDLTYQCCKAAAGTYSWVAGFCQ